MSGAAVAVLSPGDMGAAIGDVLRQNGLRVITCLAGRSELTRLRAQEAGIEDVASLDDLVREASLVLSVLVPAEAEALAGSVAEAMRHTGSRPVYADCNAISPRTMRRIARTISTAGGRCLDAGIIGGPPRSGSRATRICCSGPDLEPLLALNKHGLTVKAIGSEIGQASGLKMVYAASTKGTTALWTELLTAARALGLGSALAEELAETRGSIAAQVSASIPSMPRRARRWVGEMEEIAATFAEVGLTPRILLGAADLYRLVGETALANQTSRQVDPALEDVLNTLVRSLPPAPRGGDVR